MLSKFQLSAYLIAIYQQVKAQLFPLKPSIARVKPSISGIKPGAAVFTSINTMLIAVMLMVTLTSTLAQATGFEHMPKKQFNVLVFTKTAAWHHKSIPAGVAALEKLAQKHFFNIVWHEESHYFNDEYLKQVDVVVFLSTTGDVLNTQQQAAFERFIQSGKGYVGIHSASDTEYDWPWYQQLVGHTFVIHPTIQTARLQVETRQFAGLAGLPDSLLWTDEWYEFSDANTQELTYLLSVDERSYQPKADWGKVKGEGMGDFHPIAWYQHFDGGRAFYTALGHIKPVYEDEHFLAHVYGGIYWAATGKGAH